MPLQYEPKELMYLTYHNLGSEVHFSSYIRVSDGETHSRGFRNGPEGPKEVGSVARLSLVHAHFKHVEEEAKFARQAKLA